MATYNGFSKNEAIGAHIVFATWQTMGKNLKQWARDYFDLVIVDEAHHSEADTYKPVTTYFTGAKLAITATPDRTDDADIRGVFGPEVVNITLEEAIARGWLPRIEYHVITDKSLDEDALQKIAAEIHQGKKRFTMAEVNRRIFIKKRDVEITRIINGYSEKAVVFCASITHAERLVRSLELSSVFHSKNGNGQKDIWDRNQAVLEALRNGTVRRVCAVNAFNEGVNVPSVGLVAFCRVTGVLTIFRQQLGRGLRPGKDKLIVLDFVGNLERIQLVLEMMNKISDLHEKFTPQREIEREGYIRERFEVSGKGFEFTFSDKVVDLMSILGKVGRSFSRAELLDQLKQEANRLGRVPYARDLSRSSREGRTADMTTFASLFGSWNKALSAAGFQVNRKCGLTKAELVQQIQNEAKRLDKTPSSNDINLACKQGRVASVGVFNRVFGSLGMAWKAAGLKPLENGQPSRAELLRQLKDEAEYIGKTPSQADVARASRAGRTASQSLFYSEFGSLRKAQEAAGLLVNYHTYSNSELIKLLREATKRLGNPPRSKHLGKDGLPSGTVFQKRFGGLGKALRAAGIRRK